MLCDNSLIHKGLFTTKLFYKEALHLWLYHNCKAARFANNTVFLSNTKLHYITVMDSHDPVNHSMVFLLKNIKEHKERVFICNYK